MFYQLLNLSFWPLERCLAVWFSGWSTAERSIVNYASTDLLSPQVSTCDIDGSSTLISETSQLCWSIKNGRKCLQHAVPLSFSVYSPDMPSRLPIQDICAGLLTSVGTAIRYWFHYTLVAFAWLGVVPLTACKYQGWCSRLIHLMCNICNVLDICNWFVRRSYLQVSVYWLCELTVDAATGHALHVSGNTVFQHYSKALFSVLTYKCVDFCAFAERTCLQIAYRAVSLSRAPCVHLSAWYGWENRSSTVGHLSGWSSISHHHKMQLGKLTRYVASKVMARELFYSALYNPYIHQHLLPRAVIF